MAEPADINVDELRRRARRRLVGAVVLALGVAVVVPMLLETEQKPLGEDVSVKIPPVDEGRFVNRLTDKGDKGAPDASSSAAPSASPATPAAAGAERPSKYDTHVPESDAASTSASSTAERAGGPSATPSAAATSPRVAPADVATERAARPSASAAKGAEAAKSAAPTAKAATESTTATTGSTKGASASTKTATESARAATETTKAEAASESTKTAVESTRGPTESTKAASESTKAASEPARVAAAAASSTTDKAPAMPAHGHDAFAVQLAAFSDNKGANALAGRLKRAGYAAYTEPLKTSKGTLWRVRVGPYPSREAAAAARDKLKTEGQSGIVAAVK